MKPNPLVSVILPVYNTEKYVRAAIESVLHQTYPALEIICCDDGSTDTSCTIIEQLCAAYPGRVFLVRNDHNSGIASSRNHAIEQARGEFLAFMDADDLWEPEKIELQLRVFTEQADLDICFTFMQCFLSPELPESIKQLRFCPPDPSPGYISATAMVRTSAFHRVGLFNPTWRVGEFIDWYTRAKDFGLRSYMIPQVLFRRRIHATNTGVTERPARTDYLKIIKQSLDRKKSGTETPQEPSS